MPRTPITGTNVFQIVFDQIVLGVIYPDNDLAVASKYSSSLAFESSISPALVKICQRRSLWMFPSKAKLSSERQYSILSKITQLDGDRFKIFRISSITFP